MAAARPVVDPVPCSGCGTLLDPLRAGRVGIFDLRFHFFCRAACRAAFLGEPHVPDKDARTSARPRLVIQPLDAPILPAEGPPPPPVLPEPPPRADDASLVEPIAHTILHESPARHEPQDTRDVGALLVLMAIVAGVLAVALVLGGSARIVIGARVVLGFVGAGMLFGRAATIARDVADPHPGPALASALASLVAAALALLGKDRALASEAASLAGVIVTGAALAAWIAEAARTTVVAERSWIASSLAVPGRRGAKKEGDRSPVDDADVSKLKVFDIRPGETVIVEPGETVPVDVTLLGGDVEVLPWLGATTPARRREGDAVIAGARVVRGKLRGVCTWAGHDRAFARTLVDPRRRADVLAPVSHASRLLAERWAVVAAVIGAISAVLARRNAIEVAMIASAVHAALSNPIVASIAATHVASGILLGLRRGIVYRSADAWDRAGRVGVAMFCARGTLLLGEPELAELESPNGKLEPNEILSLAAGAEGSESHPIAAALVRAAKARGVRLDGVRNTNHYPGLGVTAVSSSGEELCVGNRRLLLEQRVSIAATEQRIAELESLGRTVILVARSSRLVGLCALQDGLRPGARAAVQHLLDAQIEPVLLAGDARETCEAIARSLDIDHIRPEVLPAERGAEVRRLTDAGMSVAVLGHAGVDDDALGVADIAVALRAAGTTPADFGVCLASDDIRDGALALAVAHRTRAEANVGLGLALVPALLGAVVISLGILPPVFAPIAAFLGGAMAVAHARRGGL